MNIEEYFLNMPLPKLRHGAAIVAMYTTLKYHC